MIYRPLFLACLPLLLWTPLVSAEELPLGAVRRIDAATTDAGGVYRLIYSPDGSLLASRRQDQKVRLWRTATPESAEPKLEQTLSGHQSTIHSCEFSPDGSTLLTASNGEDEPAIIWDVATGKPLHKLAGGQGSSSARFIQRGAAVAIAADNGGGWYDVKSGEKTHTFPSLRSPFAISPSGDQVIERVGNPVRLEFRHLFDEDAADIMLPAGLIGPATAEFLDEERFSLGLRKDPVINVWRVYEFNGDPALEHHLLAGHKEQVQALAYSPDHRFLASASWDGTVRIWDLLTYTEAAVLQGHQGHVCAVAFSPDGRWLASGAAGAEDNSILIWDLNLTLFAPRYERKKATESIDNLWWALGDENATSAMKAVGCFVAYPDLAEAQFGKRLTHLIPKAPPEKIARLIQELDDDEYVVRKAATTALLSLRPGVDYDLRTALEKTDSAEARLRLRTILQSGSKNADDTPLAQRRMLRTVLALERMAPRGSDLLKRIAATHPNPTIATAAFQAMNRTTLSPFAGDVD